MPDAVHASVRDALEKLVSDGQLAPDPVQARSADALDAVAAALDKPVKRAFFGGSSEPIAGLYLWGGVGRGKTLLMDLFFEASAEARKRRVHFHAFMDEVHLAIAERRKVSREGDPVVPVAKAITKETRLLCLDEFQVTDIADAMLLGRLFETLFGEGLVLVATSNLPPERLYKDGLNRQLFLPFLDLLAERCKVLELDSDTDYRRLSLEGQPVFFFGTGDRVSEKVDAAWEAIRNGQPPHETHVEAFGRQIHVPAAAMGAARFTFAEICEAPLGARDYLRLAQRFHTFVIDGIPHLDRARSDAAKRLILLIDTLYDRHCRLVASFEAPLDELGADDRTSFEFQRAVSRLTEMQSDAWRDGAASGS